MNAIMLLGRLTKDPEVRYYQGNEKKIARICIAVKRDADNTDFFNCAAFGKTADVLERYVKKGDPLCIRGHVQTGSYKNREGVKIPSFETVIDQITLCGTRPSSQPANTQAPAANTQAPAANTQAPTRHTSQEYTPIPDVLDEVLPFA